MKKYRTLQKNLDELESLIRSIFSGEDEHAEMSHEKCRERFILAVDGIERKVEFLKKHIAAEFSSPDPDHHLSHLSRRLDNLQSAFVGLKNNLLHDQPLDFPRFDASNSCSCSDADVDNGEVDGDGDDEESCCIHEAEEGVEGESGVWGRVYDNPLSLEEIGEVEDDGNSSVQGELICGVKEDVEEFNREKDEVEVEEEKGEEENGREKVVAEGEGKIGCYWWPLVVGVVAGGVTVAGTVVSVMVRYDVRCRFGDYTTFSVFPPPT